jgi:tol-pal system protein YbgF
MAQIIKAARRFSVRCGGELGAVAAAIAFVALPMTEVSAQSNTPRTENVFEDEVRRPTQGINPSSPTYGRAIDPSAAFGRSDGATPAVARLMVRVDQLESELSRLTGEYERLQFRYDRLNTMVMQLMQGNAGVSPTVATPAPRSPGVTYDPSANPFGSAPAPGQTPIGPEAPTNPGVATAPGMPPATAPISLQQPTGDPEVDFRAARSLLLKGEFALAETAFRRYVTMYPEAENAGEAQYWIGESLYVRELYNDAAEAYLSAVRDYPQGPRAADSLLKLSYSLNQLGEAGKACQSLRKLTRDYPNASEPVMRSVRKARADFGCS